MKIIIDLVHSADINFYKNVVNLLYKEGHEVDFIIRPRDNIIDVFENEFPDTSYKIIGKHHSHLSGKIYSLVKRDMMLFSYLRKIDFDVVTSFAGFYIAQAARLLNKPSVLFYDDYEYKMNFYLCKVSASRYVVMPKTIPSNGKNISKHNCLKELAYLSPKYFKPDPKILEVFGLKEQKYIFLREAEYSSLNYKNRRIEISSFIEHIRDFGFDVIALSHDKLAKKELSDAGCIIIEKSTDVHSLLSYAALTIAAGDTMARESCLVGTPAIYTGSRDMYANSELINRGCMFKAITGQDVLDTMQYIIKNNVKNDVRKNIDYAIRYEWEDTTDIILKHLLDVANG